MKVHRMGEEIEGQLMHATPPSMSILHKQDGAGCCHPAECWPCLSCLCPILKKRTIDWIGENATFKNTPQFCCLEPFSCNACTTIDCTRMSLLDREPYLPCCQGLGSPCGPVGYATEADMSYCLCINCVGFYNCLCRPCFGEALHIVPCQNGSCGFTLVTRFLKCFACPLNLCMSDSKAYRAVLMEQVARAQGVELTANQRRELQKAPPQVHQMAR